MNSYFDSTINIIGLIVTITSLVYAIIQNRYNVKLKRFGRAMLESLEKNIQKIRENPSHADMTFTNIQENALKLDKNEHVDEILKNAQSGARDVTTTERALEVIINDLSAFKIGFFYSKNITDNN